MNKYFKWFFLAFYIFSSVTILANDVSLQKIDKIVIDEGAEFYIGSEIFNIEINDNIMYLSNPKDNCIVALTKDGKYLKKYGREGNGPGEIYYPRTFAVIRDNVFVIDVLSRLQSFNKETTKYMKSIKKLEMNSKITNYMNKYLLCCDVDPRNKYMIEVLDADFNSVKSFGDMNLYKKEWFRAFYMLYSDYDQKGNIYAMYMIPGKIIIFDNNYKLKKTISIKHPGFKRPKEKMPIFTTQDGYKKWLSQFVFVNNLRVIENKYIIIGYTRYWTDKEFYIDILTTDGKILVNAKKFPYRLVGRDDNNFLYFYDYDDSGEEIKNIVYKYKLNTGGLK